MLRFKHIDTALGALLLAAVVAAGCTDDRLLPNQCEFDADCASGQVCAGSVCRAPCRTDADCAAGQRCRAADRAGSSLACVPPPPAATGCVRDSDCAAGEACLDGRCRPQCESNYDCQVVNPLSLCVSGACVPQCTVGRADCDGVMPNGCEVDVRSDVRNCSACGRACPAGQVCSGAACRSACADGETSCAGSCLRLDGDVSNCGRCGGACPVPPNATATCAAGACGFTCAAGFGDCDGDAVNGCEASLATAERCGACDTRCAGATPVCAAVDGRMACAAEACAGTVCAGACVDAQTDARNCGACGVACAAGVHGEARCEAGRCAVACTEPARFADCDGDPATGCEASVRTDAQHCGACGARCPDAPNAAGACAEGACVIACGAGFGDCDGARANGCEVDTRADASHCGACGNACSAPSNARAVCAAGACGFACNAGFADCDGAAANGCEVSVQTDRAHCGACGRACAAGEVCSAGACRSTCAAGEANCAGSCAALASSLSHCGACGRACPSPTNATPACAAGACGFTCAAGFGDCDGNPGNGCETNTRATAAHCGACGRACSLANATAACAGGACAVAACAAGFGDCDGSAANGCETNTTTAAAHCGACGRACALANATAACSAGGCVVARCNPGFGDCDGSAANGCEVDLRVTAAHCGACGAACSLPNATPACAAGVCAVSACATGWGNCDGSAANGCEVDTQTATANCGACGRACGAGQVCSSGACASVCATPTTFCAGRCVNLATDTAHCGACGAACPARANASPTCARGACGFACNAGFGDCDGDPANGCETNLATAPAHCGACGAACSAVNGAPSCAAGRCAIACSAGFGDCDGAVATGCETDLRTTTAHCGACGAACSLANATPACAAGACAVARCNAGFGDCDRAAANGCETNVSASPANCGACGVVCNSTNGAGTCASGACGITCAAGFGDCDGLLTNGCETNTNSTLAHCGACGAACALANATASCAGGACAVLRCAAGFGNCDGVAANGCETNLQTASAHCGACGAACATGFLCSAGACTRDCGALTNCSGVCVDPQTNVSNCGACGAACALANATPACAAGACAIAACASGWGNCDAVTANGCETSVLSSVSHCGACGNACTFANAAASCARGLCALGTCNAGFGNCDAVAANGCEADLNTSVAHCGACGTACAAPVNGSVTCSVGRCVQRCDAGYYAIALGSGIACAPVPAPRPVTPSSFAWATTPRPTFSWALAGTTDGARLQVCRDRACTMVVLDVSVTGASYAPTANLPAGRLFWRLYGRIGTNTGLTASPVWQVFASPRTATRNAAFGVAPDYNGDGYADFAVNDEYATAPTVRVYHGTAAGLAAAASTSLAGTAGTGFGQAVAPAGDVNGDGYGDLVVGAPTLSAAYVYLGSATGLGTRLTLSGTAGTGFGVSVSWAGDTDNDGYGDVVIGACAGACTNGVAYVYPGASTGLATTLRRTLATTAATTGFGSRVQGAGELNNDALDDVVVGSSAVLYQFLGAATAPNYSFAIAGLLDLDFAFDVNGDGYGDMATGTSVRTPALASTVRVYPGGSNGLGAAPTAASVAIVADVHVAGLGDTNNDGFSDVAWTLRADSLRVHHGSAAGIGATPSVQLAPVAGESDYGWGLWRAGDVNGDNLWDMTFELTNTAPCRRVIRNHRATAAGISPTTFSTIYLPLVCLL